jgi:nicotinamidase-related amidase
MPLDTIALRDDAILVVVDEQERLAAAMQHRDSVVSATVRLVRTAVLVGLPVVVTRQYPRGLGDLEPALANALAAAEAAHAQVSRADKLSFDCFRDTRFSSELTATLRKQLVIAGMETHICIAQTALSAIRSGFDVHVAADACCSRDDAHHALALQRLRAAGVVVTSSESVMYELVGEAGTDEFRSLLGIVKD